MLTKGTVVRESVHSTSAAVGDINTPFIDLTICPTYYSAYKDDVLKVYGIDKKAYQRKGVYSPSNNNKDTDLRAIFNAITYDIDEVLSRIVIRTNSNTSQQTKFTIDFEGSNFTEHIAITTKYWPVYGRCFSINPKDHVLKKGVINIDLMARIDIYIYFGHPGQFTYKSTTSKVGPSLINHSNQI